MPVLRAAEAFATHGRGVVRHAVSSGRWQRPVRGVYVTHNGPLSPEDRQWVALLACPDGSALAGATALQLHGLTGFEDTRVFVTIPDGGDRPPALAPPLPDLVVHSSVRLGDRDVHPVQRPRRTRIERSLIDLASWSPSDRYGRAAVLAAFQQGLVRAPDVLSAVDRRPTARRVGLVRESVLDAVGGIQSLPEKDFDDLVLLAGLPRPTRQRVVRGTNGRYYLDVEWAPYGVAAEIHGLPHHGVVQWSADLVRANEIVIDGPRLLIFTSYVIRHEPALVLDQLARALRAGGWTGVVRPIPTRVDRWPPPTQRR
ncbi:hypothetical protein [Aeromicrobium sp. Leaf350]|uniref:hypothetical protein n=1 Tax=Aeromicrobium sp. Leaf350 TaxID=2876565 RepID=UPI001E3656F1|nr:hypothetical protein [Aeromicrobium sp. Leaf350]